MWKFPILPYSYDDINDSHHRVHIAHGTIADGLWEWLESVGIYVRLSSFLLMWLRETRASGLWHPSAKGEVVQVRTECCYSERDGWNEMEREAGSYL